MLDDLALFVDIVDGGSLSAAARRAGLPPATVTRRLQQLEKTLGCQLLHRSARRLQATPEGLAYYERCGPLVQSLRQAAEGLDAALTRVEGLVRVLAPLNLAQGPLAPVWRLFLAQHPQVRLDLRLSNLREDVFEHGADLAIRVGDQPDSLLAQRRLGRAATALVAAPAYLDAAPPIHSPADLPAHAWVVAEPLNGFALTAPDGAVVRVPPQPAPRLRANDLALPVDMACAGLGLLLVPLVQCHTALADGRLRRVLPGWAPPERAVVAVWPRQRQLPARVRALVELLCDHAAREPLLQGGAA